MTGFFTDTIPSAARSGWGGVRWGWGRARWGAGTALLEAQAAAMWSRGTMAATPGAVAAAADAAWTAGPVEAVREYYADKAQDIAVTAIATWNDPQTFPQNGVALVSRS